jgi:hypothetical protein
VSLTAAYVLLGVMCVVAVVAFSLIRSMIAATRPDYGDFTPCRRRRCGHVRRAHEHYHPGTNCGLCPCRRLR